MKTTAVFTPEGSIMVVFTAEFPAVLRAWKTDTGTALWNAVVWDSPEDIPGPERDPDDEFDTDAFDPLSEFEHDYGLSLDMDARGTYVAATAGYYGAVAVFDVATGERVFFHRDRVAVAAVNHAGTMLALGTHHGHVTVQMLPSATVVADHDSGLDRIDAVSFTPDGAAMLVAGSTTNASEPNIRRPALSWLDTRTGAMRILDLTTTLPVPTATFDAGCSAIAWSPTGPRVLAWCSWYEHRPALRL
jgi:hypothetical protein